MSAWQADDVFQLKFNREYLDKECITKEVKLKAVRSSGPGGQHVNKVSTKVVLTFDVTQSLCLSSYEKNRIYLKLASKLTKDGVLRLHSDETRSQHKNKDLVVARLLNVLSHATRRAKPRKKSKPSKRAIEKRLKNKKMRAQKKAGRGKIVTD